jgi:hypothetical protein
MNERISKQPNAAGGHDFRFRRRGYTLAVGVERMHVNTALESWYISAALWMNEGEPSIGAHSRNLIALWYLAAATHSELGPRLVVGGPGGASFHLRPAEYDQLLEHVVPLGLLHHVPAPSPTSITSKGDVFP